MQLVYAALEVSLPFAILFSYFVHYIHYYKTTGRRNRVVPTGDLLLEQAVGSAVDRVLNDRKMALSRMHMTRDIFKKTTTMAVSDPKGE